MWKINLQTWSNRQTLRPIHLHQDNPQNRDHKLHFLDQYSTQTLSTHNSRRWKPNKMAGLKPFLFLSSIMLWKLFLYQIWTNLPNHWKQIPLLDSSGNNLDFLDPEQAFFHLGNIQIPRTYSADHNFCNLVSPHNLHLLGHRLVSRRLNNTQICTHYIQDRFITFEFYFMWCALIEQNIIPLTVYLHILNLDIHQNLDPGR